MDWWIPLLASVTGGLLTGSFALVGVILTLRNVHRQERLKDERVLRDAKRERLVRSYATLLRVVREIKYAAAGLTSPLTDEPLTDRLEQVNDRIRDLLPDYERAAVELRLESAGRALVERGDEIFALFFYHQQAVAMSTLGDGSLSERVEKANRSQNELVESTERVMYQQLQALDQPIG